MPEQSVDLFMLGFIFDYKIDKNTIILFSHINILCSLNQRNYNNYYNYLTKYNLYTYIS